MWSDVVVVVAPARTVGSLEGTGFEAVGVAVTLATTLIGTGPDVRFAFDEHGSVHEELCDVGEPFSEAFREKNLEESVLNGILGVSVHGLGFLRSNLRLKALNGRCNPCERGGGGGDGSDPAFTEEILHYQNLDESVLEGILVVSVHGLGF